MLTKKLLSTIVAVALSLPAIGNAATKYTISGKVTNGSGYTVLFVQKNGLSQRALIRSAGTFSFKNLTAAQIKQATIQLVDSNGRYAGPLVLGKKGSRVSTTFSGKVSGKTIALGTINRKTGYAVLAKATKISLYEPPRIASVRGKPIGAGEMGLVSSSTSRASSLTAKALPGILSNPGADGDRDGIPDAFDADDDGDLVLDASDADSEGLDVPYTSLFFDFRRTLNSNVRDGLTESRVNSVVGGENSFALTFFFSLPTGSSVDGGHVVCDDSLTYCRRNSPLAYYGGVSESSSDFRNRAWSTLLTSAGYPRMEKINLSGGSAMVASIQPRVDATVFRPGDVYSVVLTSGTSTVSTRSLSLTPYFVSIPAAKEYNAGSGVVQVAYDSVTAESGSIPGVSSGDPIVLSSEGNLTVTFWRPQRPALRSDESGYYDWGNLHYGVIVEDAQATCAGFYTNVSSELSVDSTPFGTGDSPLANQGANLAPYTDTIGDRAASASNTLTFTVNLKDCLARAGRSPGIYVVTLSARGEDLTGGSNAAAQTMYVQIP